MQDSEALHHIFQFNKFSVSNRIEAFAYSGVKTGFAALPSMPLYKAIIPTATNTIVDTRLVWEFNIPTPLVAVLEAALAADDVPEALAAFWESRIHQHYLSLFECFNIPLVAFSSAFVTAMALQAATRVVLLVMVVSFVAAVEALD